MPKEWGKSFAEVQRMKRADLLAYVRDVEHIMAVFDERVKNPPATFYLAWCDSNNSTPHYRHGSQALARQEAERLAQRNPGRRFYVLPAYEYAIATINPVGWSNDGDVVPIMAESDDDTPF